MQWQILSWNQEHVLKILQWGEHEVVSRTHWGRLVDLMALAEGLGMRTN